MGLMMAMNTGWKPVPPGDEHRLEACAPSGRRYTILPVRMSSLYHSPLILSLRSRVWKLM